ncbi:hypothetical protein [Sphingopyxis sp. OPL5]|uniref:hypothetical protein n=1 Tax=Sphingopyxis sp. OPL5 TaxID=2486273 RepID=UPI00223AA389|nr:hypothetical protein [Sphingopyxis sp. OPL5]
MEHDFVAEDYRRRTACEHRGLHQAAAAAAAASPPPPPPVVIIVPPRPLPPGNASLTQILPGRAIDGRFVTANSNVTGDRAFWQMKIALNVAAIGCRGLEEATLVSAYNNIIKSHGKAIKATEKTVITDLGKANKTNGIKERDRLSTQLFNYFAQPPAQRAFCARANEVAQIVSTTPPADVVAQAPAHLARLDQPFVDFYEAYAKYQLDVMEWDAKYAPPPPIMSAPAPLTTNPSVIYGPTTTTAPGAAYSPTTPGTNPGN